MNKNLSKQRLLRASLVAGVLLVAIGAGCDSAPQGEPGLQAQFQRELDALQENYDFPGATAAFALADGSTGVVATGLSDIESGTPMLPSSRMLAASIGKTFVSATLLALAQEGELDIDDQVSRWLGDEPWFSRLPNHDDVTVRHLLTHRSGLPNHVDEPEFAAAFADNWDEPGTLFTPEQLVAFVLDKPALFAAGDGWSYTDTGYILLGMVIEAASGRGYYEEVDDRFLGPLELELTSPSNRRDLPGLAAGYMSDDNAFGLPAKTLLDDGRMAWNPSIEWTGGGLASNPVDLVVWAKALFEGTAMGGAYLGELLDASPISAGAASPRYGAGVAIYDDGPIGTWYSHGGWIPGYTSSLRYYPEHRVAIAFQINTDIGIVDDSTDLYKEMAARLEKAIAGSLAR